MKTLKFSVLVFAILLSQDQANSQELQQKIVAKERNTGLAKPITTKPVFHIAKGLNNDGTLLKNYRRGLNYAIDYFGNYGPYYIYLLGDDDEQNIRDIYYERAKSRVDHTSDIPASEQISRFLKRPNVITEMKAVLAGKSEGGLTWSRPPRRVYEDVTTNAKGRELDAVENTWGALHEYHHVFQIAHCDSYAERDSDKNLNSWMSEGMATYSSAVFMERLGLINLEEYMLDLRKTGGNIGRLGINKFVESKKSWRLDNENYWESGRAAQVYYMLGAWGTAYLIHEREIPEKTVLKRWYFDVPKMGKSASFNKHMGLTLEDFYNEFRKFISQPDSQVMKIFSKKAKTTNRAKN